MCIKSLANSTRCYSNIWSHDTLPNSLFFFCITQISKKELGALCLGPDRATFPWQQGLFLHDTGGRNSNFLPFQRNLAEEYKSRNNTTCPARLTLRRDLQDSELGLGNRGCHKPSCSNQRFLWAIFRHARPSWTRTPDHNSYLSTSRRGAVCFWFYCSVL